MKPATIDDAIELIRLLNNSLKMLNEALGSQQKQIGLLAKQMESLEQREVHRILNINARKKEK